MLARLAGVGLAAVLLAGCATGNANDAGPDATEEAQATNVIAGIEATSVVEQFFDPTPTPLPYPTRIPVLHNLRLTSDVGEQNVPTNQLSVYNRSGPLYAAAQVADVHPGQSVVGIWRDGGNNEVATQTVAIGNDRELVWIALRWDGANVAPPGDYAVYVYVDGPGTNAAGEADTVRTELGSITFQIQ